MALSREAREVLKRFYLIGLGIPAVLLIFVSVLYFSPWAIHKAQVSNGTLNIVTIGLAATSLAIWAFFSFLMYRRLWKIFPYISEKEKGWSYAQGTFGFVGVGVSTPSVLGIFYYLLTGDYSRGVCLIALSFVLALIEATMFPNRIADVDQMIAGME